MPCHLCSGVLFFTEVILGPDILPVVVLCQLYSCEVGFAQVVLADEILSQDIVMPCRLYSCEVGFAQVVFVPLLLLLPPLPPSPPSSPAAVLPS